MTENSLLQMMVNEVAAEMQQDEQVGGGAELAAQQRVLRKVAEILSLESPEITIQDMDGLVSDGDTDSSTGTTLRSLEDFDPTAEGPLEGLGETSEFEQDLRTFDGKAEQVLVDALEDNLAGSVEDILAVQRALNELASEAELKEDGEAREAFKAVERMFDGVVSRVRQDASRVFVPALEENDKETYRKVIDVLLKETGARLGEEPIQLPDVGEVFFPFKQIEDVFNKVAEDAMGGGVLMDIKADGFFSEKLPWLEDVYAGIVTLGAIKKLESFFEGNSAMLDYPRMRVIMRERDVVIQHRRESGPIFRSFSRRFAEEQIKQGIEQTRDRLGENISKLALELNASAVVDGLMLGALGVEVGALLTYRGESRALIDRIQEKIDIPFKGKNYNYNKNKGENSNQFEQSARIGYFLAGLDTVSHELQESQQVTDSILNTLLSIRYAFYGIGGEDNQLRNALLQDILEYARNKADDQMEKLAIAAVFGESGLVAGMDNILRFNDLLSKLGDLEENRRREYVQQYRGL